MGFSYLRDCAEIAGWRPAETASGDGSLLIDRRATILGAAAALGFSSRSASAQARELVLCNWGGEPAKAYTRAYGEPFSKESGIKFSIDGSGPQVGKIRAMVEAKRVVWDICDNDVWVAISLGRRGYLEPIDYSIVDRTKVKAEWAVEHGIAAYAYSWIPVWSKSVFGDAGPSSPADMWDTKRFPGRRAFYKNFQSTCEYALIADGVPASNLYPLDIPRAVAKLKSLGSDVVFYTSLAESQRAFAAGEYVCGVGLNSRMGAAVRDSGGRLGRNFNGAMYCNGAFIIPKGNPAGREAACRFIASAQQPDRQAAVFELIGMGPANPAAVPLIPPELQAANPSDPANLGTSFVRDEGYYAENFEASQQQFLSLLAS